MCKSTASSLNLSPHIIFKAWIKNIVILHTKNEMTVFLNRVWEVIIFMLLISSQFYCLGFTSVTIVHPLSYSLLVGINKGFKWACMCFKLLLPHSGSAVTDSKGAEPEAEVIWHTHTHAARTQIPGDVIRLSTRLHIMRIHCGGEQRGLGWQRWQIIETKNTKWDDLTWTVGSDLPLSLSRSCSWSFPFSALLLRSFLRGPSQWQLKEHSLFPR